MQQLRKLRYCLATVEAKAKAILSKVYAAAFYGIEAAEGPAADGASLTAAIIDVFWSRNDNRHVGWFFSAFLGDKKEIDPMAQIFVRRAMQIRRAICKRKGALEQFKTILGKYASRCKDQQPKWYYQDPGQEGMPPTCNHIPPPKPMHRIGMMRSKRWDPWGC